MNLPVINITAILPIVILSVFGIIIMVAEPFLRRERKRDLAYVALLGIGLSLLGVLSMATQRGAWYSGLWLVDDYSVFFHVVFLIVAALTVLSSVDFLSRESIQHPEYYALVLFATVGMIFMAASNELVMLFIGLEILSIATYILAGFRRTDLRSNESALKYFLLGSFASAFFLYGTALIFGATGSTNLLAIAEALRSPNTSLSLVYLSLGMLTIALSFKVAVVPFHVWTPDVYEGAPTPVTGFMSVGPKAAGFAVFLRVFLTAFPTLIDKWFTIIWIIAALTMILGNVVAVAQTSLKRVLAYSSIAHAGYIAMAFATASERGVSAVLFYTLAYALTNLGAFAIVAALSRSEDRLVNLGDYSGLASKRPGLAALLTLFMLSLAGIPGTAGFAAKFFIFRAAVESGLIWLTVIGVLTTVISFYYYLAVIVQMYMRSPSEDFADVRIPAAMAAALIITAVGVVYLGILPTQALEWSNSAALSAMR